MRIGYLTYKIIPLILHFLVSLIYYFENLLALSISKSNFI